VSSVISVPHLPLQERETVFTPVTYSVSDWRLLLLVSHDQIKQTQWDSLVIFLHQYEPG